MEHEVVARARTPRGETVVRRRGDVLELRVNGVFVMDTAHTDTERMLATATLQQVERPGRVLVGGLGLGYTVRALLDDDRVERVDVAEIEAVVLDWMREGVLPGADVLSDPRVAIRIDDVRAAVAEAEPGSYDVILLDVDNGPDFLVYAENAAVYDVAFLRRCHDLLDDGGMLAVWSSTRSPDLAGALRAVFDHVDVVPVPVRLQGREEHYFLFTSKMSS